jgi:hypothetical protein
MDTAIIENFNYSIHLVYIVLNYMLRSIMDINILIIHFKLEFIGDAIFVGSFISVFIIAFIINDLKVFLKNTIFIIQTIIFLKVIESPVKQFQLEFTILLLKKT